ncbi:tagaturonate reductase [Pseudolactococcus yaeyamensis]
MRLSEKTLIKKRKDYPIKVVQFGEGRFLRSFIELQIEEMNENGLFNGSVAVVQPLKTGRIDALKEQDNLYTVKVAGIKEGIATNAEKVITVIKEVVNPYEAYQSFLNLASLSTLEVITSNTTEAGITWMDEKEVNFLEECPKSFPAKLTAFLYKRYLAELSGLLILPCELIEKNGEQLKKYIIRHAKNWNLGDSFIEWLISENIFVSTLVDRIVSAPLETDFAYTDSEATQTEPFMFFAIEAKQAEEEKVRSIWPAEKIGLNVIVVQDLAPYRERKVRLLNGAHTAMAMVGLLKNIKEVAEFTSSEFGKAYIERLYDEMIPLIDLPEAEVRLYASEVIERYLNPYLHHQLKDIALNSVSKFKTRLLPSLLDYRKKFGQEPLAINEALQALEDYYALHQDEAIFSADEPIESVLERL